MFDTKHFVWVFRRVRWVWHTSVNFGLTSYLPDGSRTKIKGLNTNQLGLRHLCSPTLTDTNAAVWISTHIPHFSFGVSNSIETVSRLKHPTKLEQDNKRLVVANQPSKIRRLCKFYLKHTELLTNFTISNFQTSNPIESETVKRPIQKLWNHNQSKPTWNWRMISQM